MKTGFIELTGTVRWDRAVLFQQIIAMIDYFSGYVLHECYIEYDEVDVIR